MRSGLRFAVAISNEKQSLWFRSAINFQSCAPLSCPMSAVVWTLAGFAPSQMNRLTMPDEMMKEAGHWSSSPWSPECLLGTSGPGCVAIRNGHVTSYLGGNQYI